MSELETEPQQLAFVQSFTAYDDPEDGKVFELHHQDENSNNQGTLIVAERDIVCTYNGYNSEYNLFYVCSDPGSDSDALVARSIILDVEMPHVWSFFEQHYGVKLHVVEFLGSNKPDPVTTIFVSTLAGTQQAQRTWTNLLQPILENSTFAIEGPGTLNHMRIHTSKSADFITSHAQASFIYSALLGKRQLIVLLTGDGGVVDVLDALHTALSSFNSVPSTYAKPILAVLPSGTGNALAHSSGITADGTNGLSTLMRGTPRRLPTFCVTLPAGSYALDGEGKPAYTEQATREAPPTQTGLYVEDSWGANVPTKTDDSRYKVLKVYGAVVFSWALHSTLVADSDTPEYRKHGTARFQMAAKALLFPDEGKGDPHAFRGKVSYQALGGSEWKDIDRDEHAYVLLTLCSNLEEKFCISPSSKPLDGVLRLVQFAPHPEGGKGVTSLMEKAYDVGKHVNDPHVGYEAVEGFRLCIEEEEERWRRVCVDGKIFVVPRGGVVEVRRVPVGEEICDLLVPER